MADNFRRWPRDRIVECEGKERYESAGAARLVLDSRRRIKGKGAGRRLLPYRCAFCHGWHIGTRRVEQVRR